MILYYLLVLSGVCGLAIASLFALKYLKSGSLPVVRGNPMRVVGRQQLGPGATLFVVEYDGGRFLLGTSRSSLTLIQRSPVE